MIRWYVLDGHDVREGTLEEYEEMMLHGDRRVGETFMHGVRVSTMFLRSGEPPEFFETMVFGGDYDEWAWRYRTWDQAEAGHRRVVRAIERGERP